MPQSKPNRRWSKHRRWDERRRIARPSREHGSSNDVVHTGESVFDPVTNAQRMGRFQGAMLAAVLADISHARTIPSVLGWLAVGGAMLTVGILLDFHLAVSGGHAPPIVFAMAVLLTLGGLRIVAEQPESFARLHRRGRPPPNM